MLDALFEFSRSNCIGICAFLVPANLLATLQTLIMSGLRRPQSQMRLITGCSIVYALVMVLHVYTWFAAGVVMIPTYVLMSLGCTCLVINLGAIAQPLRMSNLLSSIWIAVSYQLSVFQRSILQRS